MSHKNATPNLEPRGVRVPPSFLLAISCLVGGCGGTGGDRPASPPTAPAKATSTTVTDYPLQGVVKSVGPEDGRVVIKHREIPGFMPAMTMPFRVSDPATLDSINPGDEVEGTLRVSKQAGEVTEYQVLDLGVTLAAKPKTHVIDLSKGDVRIRQPVRKLEVGDTVPDFTMTGQDGKDTRLSDLRGKVVVLTFIYTRCPMPDFCPMMDRKFSDLAQHVSIFPNKADGVRLISLSFDPEHDSPEILRKHAQVRGAIPPLWTYAVASHAELAKVAAPLGLFFGADGGEIAHNLCTAVIDPAGRLARLEVGTRANRWETADFLKTIDSLLPGAGR